MARFSDAALTAGRAACRVLGWTPQTFWTATPAELALALAALAAPQSERPLTAKELMKLESADG